jgi:predicted amidohydrolase YtcJ
MKQQTPTPNRATTLFAALMTIVWLWLLLSPPALQAQPAERIFLNGNFLTMDPGRPHVEAVAVTGQNILAVGSNESIRRHLGENTEVIDLQNRFVMPGFIEGHGHFVGLGQSLMMLDLSEVESWDEIVEMVAAATQVTPPGQWIVGRGWHQSKWKQPPAEQVAGYPKNDAVSRLTPNHPVLLTHASGHMNFANDYAMRLAKIDETTPAPRGGEILADETGKPIGVFRSMAQGLVTAAFAADERKKDSAQRLADLRTAVELASAKCLEFGITSFQDAGTTFEIVDLLRDLAVAEQLPVRLYVMIREDNERLSARLRNYKFIGLGNEFLTVRALKRSIDGALGPHGAWMLAPYEDLPGTSGLNTASIESVVAMAELAVEHDFQMCVHAIGDRANREVLDIYQSMFQQHPSSLSRRWRIEHAQHLHPDDIPRFGQLGVIASMQGIHCTSDAVYVLQRLGARRSQQGAYVWRSLIDSGAVVTNGTDAPVERITPFESIYASVTRKINGEFPFFPEQCMTRQEALQSYTLHCAYAAFEETRKGSLVPGKLADMVVLDTDLLKCPEDSIRQTQVLMTIVGGKIVYERPLED